MKKVLIGLAIALGILAAGVITVIALLVTGVMEDSEMSYNKMVKLANNYTFAASQVESFQIDTSYHSVHFVQTDTNEIQIEEYQGVLGSNKPVTVNHSGGTLSVESKPGFTIFGIYYGYLKVYLPKNWNEDLNVQVSSGKITTTDDTYHFSTVYMKCTSGSVRVHNIESDNSVTLKSTSGGVSGEKIKAENAVLLESSSGAVRVAEIVAQNDVTLKSTSGGVSTQMIDTKGDVSLHSSSGSVLGGNITAANITADSTSGGVTIDKVNTEHFTVSSMSGTVYLNGGTGQGSLQSSSGGVKLKLDKVTGNIEAKSTSGSVMITIPKDTCFMFHAQTTSGSIKTPIDEKLDFNSSGKKATGSHGKNAEITISATASSGNVHLEWI